jgi:transcriptional regulator with PAS, ATPase and Fis domain
MGGSTMTAIYRDRVELPILEVRIGEDRAVPLHVEPLVVGTHSDSDIVLSDPRVSRRHCQLSLGERGVLVEDLSSKNGTLVGGIEVVRAWAPLNVPILVGDTHLVVRPLGGTVEVPLSLEMRFGEAIGASIPMRALFARLERAASTELTVLLLGESGTGKELLAHGIHAGSARRDGPFVPFDCGAVPPALIEAELFGYVRGAFTGAVADHKGVLAEASSGTLFLDEIGELPLDLQPKLLRALESREFRPVGARGYQPFDARILAATHRALRQDVANGTFREDLFYRLAVIEARVPPLRERRDDIELLVQRFLDAQSPPRSIRDLPSGALAMLRAYDWPGNVRELKNAVSRLLLFPESVASEFRGAAPGESHPEPHAFLPLHLPLKAARDQVVDAFERAYIVGKLTESSGNVSRAADAMQVSRQFVHRLMERYDIRRTDLK